MVLERIAILLAGVTLGIQIHRFIVSLSIGAYNPTVCDLCRYNHKKAARRRPGD